MIRKFGGDVVRDFVIGALLRGTSGDGARVVELLVDEALATGE